MVNPRRTRTRHTQDTHRTRTGHAQDTHRTRTGHTHVDMSEGEMGNKHVTTLTNGVLVDRNYFGNFER